MSLGMRFNEERILKQKSTCLFLVSLLHRVIVDAFQIDVLGFFMKSKEILGLKTELRIFVDRLRVGDSPFSPLSHLKLQNKKFLFFGHPWHSS